MYYSRFLQTKVILILIFFFVSFDSCKLFLQQADNEVQECVVEMNAQLLPSRKAKINILRLF